MLISFRTWFLYMPVPILLHRNAWQLSFPIKGIGWIYVEGFRKLFEMNPADVKPAVDKLMTKFGSTWGALKRLQDFESQIWKWLIGNGRRLFLGGHLCHMPHPWFGGRTFAPISLLYNATARARLTGGNSLPEFKFVREYETYLIKTKTGD